MADVRAAKRVEGQAGWTVKQALAWSDENPGDYGGWDGYGDE